MNRIGNTARAGSGFSPLVFTACACLLATSAFGDISPGNAMPGDQHWDNQFGYAGASDRIYAVSVLGGKVYVGGLMTQAGNTEANNIAGYDGTNWFQLNNGVSGGLNITYVFTLANDGTNLYAGGWFTNADDSGAVNIARWDGSSWHPLAGGLPNSLVYAIKIAGTNFFASGLFTSMGSVSASCVAQWTGTTWKPLGTGLTGGTGFFTDAVALEYDGTYLYAGGNFAQAGGVTVSNIARWNGASWSAMGSGFPGGQVFAICSLGGNVYAGGGFTNSALGITNLACWNGSAWTPVGPGPDGTVQSLVTDGTNLYAGGYFKHINGIAANRVAKWNGTTWSALGTGIQGFGSGTSPSVLGMAFDSHYNLYAGGNFNQAGGIGASYVAGCTGTNWFALGGTTSKGMTHFLGQVQSLYNDGTYTYAGGIFTEGGSNIVNQVAKWNGTSWQSMGTATPGALPEGGPVTFASYDGYLYAGGYFTNLGPFAVDRIGVWDGVANWDDIGGAPDGEVNALAVDGSGYLWVGGAFTNIGGYNIPGLTLYIAGTGWGETAGYLSGGNQSVNALAWDGNVNMYVGGNFTNLVIDQFGDTMNATNIAVFDENGGTWSSLGGPFNGTVNCILVTNGVVYVGGTFTAVGGTTVNGIAEWNGSSWSALGSGVSGVGAAPFGVPAVTALAWIGNNLYIGGSFTSAGGAYAQGVAVWNGSNWSGLGSGVFSSALSGDAGYVDTLLALGNDLYAGGNFTSAGAKPSAFFAHWNDQNDYYPTPHPLLTRQILLANKQFQFRLTGTSGETYTLLGSTNLMQWTPLMTNSATLYDFTDTNTSKFPHRFYRAMLDQ